MSNKVLPFLAILAFTVAVAWADDKPKADQPTNNLITNGNMEEVAEGKPVKWGAAVAEGGKIDLASSTEQPKEGKRCMHVKGNAEWAVAYSQKVPLDRKKTYTLTGFARAKSGTARIKIDYYQGDQHLGMTESEDASGDKWQQLKVAVEPDGFPEATHILACAVVTGEFEAWFDDFVLTAKAGK